MSAQTGTRFPPYNPIGPEEAEAAARVVRTGMLSDFLGSADPKFYGGENVRRFEKMWSDYHGVGDSVTFNSATSALIAAVGAVGIMPGDEVLVIAYSMCISATAPLFYGGVPVFVDIEEDMFCMDPALIEARITDRTRAILTVDLFGQSSDMVAIRGIADKHGLKIICDAAHVPGCRYNGGYAGTFGDIGVYSFNQHKIVHCGEGAAAVTNDPDMAMRLRLIRNHGEAAVEGLGFSDFRNIVGGNFRLPEIEAAIMIEQLKKMPDLLEKRIALADCLTEELSKLEFVMPPKVRDGSDHVYYLYPIRYHPSASGIDRAQFLKNLGELGVPVYKFMGGYIRPLYLDPPFSHKSDFRKGHPFDLADPASVDYRKGLCPVVERLHEQEMIVTAFTYPPLTRDDMKFIASAFEKAAMAAAA